ncbi:uncharacterized protein K452DRAFT_297115 [Aplosporella prunicola CBS 121167]|uniref:Protein BNI4 n=1 Tax=Aplosporella prunicola CBS 121167 TaxID=1176127 RepID=A0A6A6BJ65_9PEZI|nr:uncharacterized protein K452DRAFT_297115 [Aplosporella prunicola CBS 121167]KAF2143365.1 hypothetical protein K452DRAFT_297115 [Aplosporella prunicola CBS 121167]
MAEVLAPITQPSTLLHTPADSQSPHQSTRTSPMPRTQYYNTTSGGIGYRGNSATPVQTYAFQTSPQLRQENRSTSAPVNPYQQQQTFEPSLATAKQGHATHPSSSSGSTASSSSSSNRSLQRGSKDDTAILPHRRRQSADESLKSPTMASRPLSINLSTSVPDLSLGNFDLPVRPSPDRYRRRSNTPNSPSTALPPDARSAAPSGSGMAGVAHLYKGAGPGSPTSRPGHVRTSSADDSSLPRQGPEQAKRYRRRSVGGFNDLPSPSAAPSSPGQSFSSQQTRPDTKSSNSYSEDNNSHESVSSASNSNRPSSSKRETTGQNSPKPSSPHMAQQGQSPNVPARGSSAEATKKMANPSPLSRPADGSAPPSRGSSRAPAADSPAAQHLAALGERDHKGVKSRLRRAFSFGSAAELRKATAENHISSRGGQRKIVMPQEGEEMDPETAALAAQQEAAGIGNSIYSGQGGVFSGSTDNLSISSTASSASVMLRKMGKGMKKSGRSLKGLFRPKSVIGVPAADSAVQPSLAQVSHVTVEAEREKVNVNANPAEHSGGGTGFPKLERNSLEVPAAAERPSSSPGSNSADISRKSIMGGERERAEVLAAVRKGILKRTVTDSPSPMIRPADNIAPGFTHSADTPNSSAPSTPGDDQRVGPSGISGEDYFGGPRLAAGSTKSLPNTPHGQSRNISFSPRIQFHDAWSSSEYDRRGDIATCNRLTPMLAQQIKEELNTFKMEMEVHEMSKPHTHFF